MGEWKKVVYLGLISFQLYANVPLASGYNLTDLCFCQDRWKLSEAELLKKQGKKTKERKKLFKNVSKMQK